MKKVKLILIGAGARGAWSYASYAKDHPEECQVVGIAEPDEERRQKFSLEHDIPLEKQFNDWKDILACDRFADGAIIATQDKMHVQPSLVALEKGYEILLEKPISPSKEECLQLLKASRKYQKRVSICHVLRYTDFFSTLKDIASDPQYGETVSIQHSENVANWHHAHSFCRGNWGNEEQSSPMLLAKSCHDMDVILWLMDKKCKAISSVGQLFHFRPEKAPKGAPLRCLDGCPHRQTCPYYAPDFYLGKYKGWARHFTEDLSSESIIEQLKTSDYGRCVYHSDNDVVDNQSVLITFEDDTNCQFTMTSLTREQYRETRIIKEWAEIRADTEQNKITIYNFKTKSMTTIDVPEASSGHGGGDAGIMIDFVESLRDENHVMKTNLEDSIASHLMIFAAEESRHNQGETIDFTAFSADSTS